MFDNNLKTEPIPERVFELCKMVSKGKIADKDAKSKIEPVDLNDSVSSTAYYSIIREVCVGELKLISRDENDDLNFIGDKKVVKDLNAFRYYCNSLVYNNCDTHFYKIASAYLESNEKWLNYKTLTDVNIRKEVQDRTGIPLITEQMMLGMRFWMSFLGFGYIQEAGTIYFLPNMYVALQDFCELAELEKNKEYTVSEFVEKIYNVSSVAVKETKHTQIFNLAMSNALRQMHDDNQIVLKKVLDSKEKWNLYTDEFHEFKDQITHIVYKGVKRR